LRTTGKGAGLLALILDVAKGAVAVGISYLAGGNERTAAIAGFAP